jgi:hypothetical protein
MPLYLQALQAGAMALLEEARTGQWTQHDLQRLLLAAERLGLDPLGGEIYAVPGGPDAAGPALLGLGVASAHELQGNRLVLVQRDARHLQLTLHLQLLGSPRWSTPSGAQALLSRTDAALLALVALHTFLE